VAEVGRRTLVRASRLEAFSDGVIAIIITIMVLEIRPPAGHELVDWIPLVPVVLAYLLSFTFVAIYWNNHHHLLRATEHITPSVMWANMLLLFSLSLVPVTTSWLGEDGNYLRPAPVALYAAVGLLSGLSYYVLALRINRANPDDVRLRAFVTSRKGAASPFLYIAAIIAAFIAPAVALVLLVVSAALWFIPDRVLVSEDAES
jgi:uncharacterized membrane protein